MKKNRILYIALLLIPLLVVYIAVTPGSVTVRSQEEVYTTTFMTFIEGSMVGWCAPVMVLMTYAIFALVVLYGLRKKEKWLRATRAVAFAALVISTLPLVVRGDFLIIPSVWAALLLACEWFLAHLRLKDTQKEEAKPKRGERLPRK